MKEHLRLFFEAWMGKGVKLWFNLCGPSGDELHLRFRQDTDGMSLRRALVRGSLGTEEKEELRESVPEFCRELLGWWRRKEAGLPGQRRELCEDDYLVNGVMQITAEDWERWIGKKVGNKAADFMGVHTNPMKAMMKKGCVLKEGTEPGVLDSASPSPALGVVHAIRRGLQAILNTGLVADSCYGEVLCTLNKVVGSVAVLDSRPIGLLFLWRNMMMGIQLYKIVHTLESLEALARLEYRHCSGQMADWREGWSGHRHCSTGSAVDARVLLDDGG